MNLHETLTAAEDQAQITLNHVYMTSDEGHDVRALIHTTKLIMVRAWDRDHALVHDALVPRIVPGREYEPARCYRSEWE